MDISYKEIHAMNKEEARRQIIDTYFTVGSISLVAKPWHTSHSVVRKWVRKFDQRGKEGLADESRKPHSSPRKVSDDIEQKVLETRKKTSYGRKRLTWYLACEEGITLSSNTIRHILNRHGFKSRKKPRKIFYPAHWTWEIENPFLLAQVDTKDILDKGTLGTKLWTHMVRRKLPRYQ